MSSVCFWFHIIGVFFCVFLKKQDNYGATASPYDRELTEYEVLADESAQAESPGANIKPTGFMGTLEENVPDFNENFLSEMGDKFNFLKPHLEANKESSAEASAEKSKRSSDKIRGALDDRLSGMTDKFQSFGNMNSITDNANRIPGVGSYVSGNKESEPSAAESEKTKRNIQDDAGDKFTEFTSGWSDKVQSMGGGMGGGNQENGDSDKPNPVDKITEWLNSRRGGS